MKKILVIAYDVAPLELISSQRVNYFIDFFNKLGFKIDILTANKSQLDGPCTDLITYNNIANYATFHIVDKNKTESSNNTEPQKIKKNIRKLLKKLRVTLVTIFGMLVDYRTIWALKSIKYYNKNLIKKNYDYIFSSSLPVGVNLIAAYIKKRQPQAFWISDHRDLWALNHVVERSFFASWLDKKIELKTLSEADLLITVSDDLAKIMCNLHKKEILTVMNGFIPKEFESLIENRTFFINKYKTEVINIVYAGNIYEGRRNPNQLIQTIANCNSKAEINIHFFGLYLENIKEFVNVNKFSDFVFFHSVKPRKEILEICKAADFNLFLESGNDDARGVLTGKLFELIAIGRPIIVIGPMRDFKSCQIIEEAGLLVHWDMLNLENIYFSLSKYKLNTWVNFSKIDKYSREMQVMKIIPYINH